MKKRKSPARKKRRVILQVSVMLSLAVMISLYFMVMVSARNTYTITDGDTVTQYSTTSTEVAQVLREAGIKVSHNDLVTSSSSGSSTRINIQRSQYVTINYEGNQISTATYDSTVGQLLDNLCLFLTSDSQITSDGQPISLDTPVTDGMSIEVATTTTKTRVETVSTPYETYTYQDPSLAAGETVVKTAGTEGQKQLTYTDTYVSGQLTGSMLTETVILSTPVDEVILVGTSDTKPTEEVEALEIYVEPEPEPEPEPVYTAPVQTASSSGSTSSSSSGSSTSQSTYTPPVETPTYSGNTITTASGEVITYTKSLSVTATAYCLKGTTASGTQSRYGAIAVDPSVIPLGTRMYIVSDDGNWIYGYATAEDTGGAIKGNKIDLFYDSYDTCIQFGRRTCTVYILD